MITDTNKHEASCSDIEDPDIFFPDPSDYAKVSLAKSVCGGCPLIMDCLETALADTDAFKWGIWGGTTPEERRAIRRTPATRLRVLAETKAMSERNAVSIRKVGESLPSYNKNTPFSQ
jgi:hypothetical protein